MPPLISVNLRDPGGLASHMGFIGQQVANSLQEHTHADLLIVSRSGVGLYSHQSLLEPLSPLLSSLFQQHNCCNCSGSYCGRRETIQLHLPDIKQETLELLLRVIYTGTATYTKRSSFKKVEDLLTLLDIKIPGEFKYDERKEGKQDQTNHFETPESSRTSQKSKHPDSSRDDEGPTAKKTRLAQDGKKSQHPQHLLIQIAQDLMPFESNKIVDCNVPGCSEKVSKESMTSHFEAHFREHEDRQVGNQAMPKENQTNIMDDMPVIFACDHCSKTFKFRVALEHHKKKHKSDEKDQSRIKKENSLNPVSLDDELNDVPVKKPVCPFCECEVDSSWHLPPMHHNCSSVISCEVCKKTFKYRVALDHHRRKHIECSMNLPKVDTKVSKEGNKEDSRGKSSINASPIHRKISLERRDIKDSEHASVSLKLENNTPDNAKDLKSHENIKMFSCNECSKAFRYYVALQGHKKVHKTNKLHGDSLNREQFGPDVSKVSNTNNTLEMFSCDECDKTFRYNVALQRHKKVHQKVLQNVSDTDDQDSETNANLDTFSCDECSKTFRNIDALQGHKSVHKPQTPLQPVVCSYCLIEFESPWHLPPLRHKCKNFDTGASKESMNVTEDPIESNSTEDTWKCSHCQKIFSRRLNLKIHIGLFHYYQKLKNIYSGTVCGICDASATNNKLLIKHVCSKHDSVLNYLMAKDGLSLPPKAKKINTSPKAKQMSTLPLKAESIEKIEKENVSKSDHMDTDIFSYKQCQICLKNISTRINLQIHYVMIHYWKKFLKKQKTDKNASHQCPVCEHSREPGVKKHIIQKHVASKHTDLLIKFMKKDKLWIGKSKIYSIGENGFNIKKVRVDVKNEGGVVLKVKENKKKRISLEKKTTSQVADTFSVRQVEITVPQLSMKQLMTCFLCQEDFNQRSQSALLTHYSQEHYRLELERNYIDRPDATWTVKQACPKCGQKVDQRKDFVNHIGVHHRAVEEFLPEKYRIPSDAQEMEPAFPCPLSDCSSAKETNRSLMVHLLVVHFQKDMEAEFGPMFKSAKTGERKCPICSCHLLDNYLGFMKHIAVEHEYVRKFVDKENTDCSAGKEESVCAKDSDIVPINHLVQTSTITESKQVEENADSDKMDSGPVLMKFTPLVICGPKMETNSNGSIPERTSNEDDIRAVLDSDSD